MACRLCFFIKNCRKQRFACKRRAKNGKNHASGHPRKVENQKNSVSGCHDELFFVKMNRRGAPKFGKFGKYAFGESRSSKNLKSESSGCPEKAKLDISKRKVKPEE